MSDKSQTIAVVAKIFWRPNNQNAIKTSRIVKWVSLINICAVIWLEFALFSDIASRLFNITNLECKILFIFITSFLVVYFTVKFGLRGFVFADFFQSPIIGVSALCLITGCAIAFFTKNNVDFSNLFHPINSYSDCGMFAIHVIFVNFFFVLVTEGHWLRIWIFGQKETQLQIKSLSVTSVIWLILILIGLLSFVITGGKSGESAIVGLLQQLHLLSPVFIVFFWLGGVAALFACADSQIFSFLIVNEFDYKSGQLKNKLMDKISPFPIAMAFACFFSIIYCILRVNNVPFEKIVFIVMPLSLNTLPAFVRAAKGYSQKPKLILLSIICYLIFSIIGLFQPNNELAWTLIAAAWPLFFSLIALINFNINEN